MANIFSDPERASDPQALPDVEIFYGPDYDMEKGYYYWYCFPGCLPDSEPYGPFETYQEALEDVRRDNFGGCEARYECR
jgi:hypothetical protein